MTLGIGVEQAYVAAVPESQTPGLDLSSNWLRRSRIHTRGLRRHTRNPEGVVARTRPVKCQVSGSPFEFAS